MSLTCELWDVYGPLLRTEHPGPEPPKEIYRYPISEPHAAERIRAAGGWVAQADSAPRRPQCFRLADIDRVAVIFIYHEVPALTTTVSRGLGGIF